MRSAVSSYVPDRPIPISSRRAPVLLAKCGCRPHSPERAVASEIAEDRSLNIYDHDLVGSHGDTGLSLSKIGGKRRKTGSLSFSRVERDRDEVHVIVKRGKMALVGGEVKTAIEDAIAEEKRQRELRRLRQIRYRKNKDRKAQSLEKETQQLEREVLKLEQRLRTISSAIPERQTAWNVVVHYFNLFRDGYRENSRWLTTSAVDSCAYNEFLQTKMASDVVHQYGRGPESLLKHWKRNSLWFNDVKYRLVCLEQDTDDSLIATTTTSFIMTETTLLKVFPHLCNTREPNENPHIAAKLLGKRIIVRGTTRFVWDCVFGWVTHLVEEADLLTPLLSILENLEDVSTVFDGSLIQPNFQSTTSESSMY
ncbi:hypothetical protein ON010_g4319 [Phytophthora cinnamomi]|nr:hypothetical protein ON010_g4319 [Phytophthora cinnamomi]